MKSHSCLRIGCAQNLELLPTRGRSRRAVLALCWRVFCIFCAAASLARAGGWGEGGVDVVELESGVRSIPEKDTSWSATGNGCRVARIELDEKAQRRVRLDGKPVASYDDVTRFLFSADGSAYACMASPAAVIAGFLNEGLASLMVHENLKIAERLLAGTRTNMKVETKRRISAEYGNERMGLFLFISSLLSFRYDI